MKKFLFILIMLVITSCTREVTLQEVEEKDKISPYTLPIIYHDIKECQDLGKGFIIERTSASLDIYTVYCKRTIKEKEKEKDKEKTIEDDFKEIEDDFKEDDFKEE